MSIQETQRKRAWLMSKGRAYSDRANEKAKAYQETFFGTLARRAGVANTGAKLRGLSGRITAGDLVNAWAKQNGFDAMAVPCALCSLAVSEWHIDHATPVCKGGKHEAANIQLLCHECHKAKTRAERDPFNDQQDLFAAAGTASTDEPRARFEEDGL